MTATEIDYRAPVVAHTTLEIAATPQEVWDVLIDVDQWPSWNSDIQSARLAGPMSVGSTIHWRSGGMEIRSRLVIVEPGKRLVWNGDLGAVHDWTVSAAAAGTLLRNAESIAGPFAPGSRGLEAFLATWNLRLAEETHARVARR